VVVRGKGGQHFKKNKETRKGEPATYCLIQAIGRKKEGERGNGRSVQARRPGGWKKKEGKGRGERGEKTVH